MTSIQNYMNAGQAYKAAAKTYEEVHVPVLVRHGLRPDAQCREISQKAAEMLVKIKSLANLADAYERVAVMHARVTRAVEQEKLETIKCYTKALSTLGHAASSKKIDDLRSRILYHHGLSDKYEALAQTQLELRNTLYHEAVALNSASIAKREKIELSLSIGSECISSIFDLGCAAIESLARPSVETVQEEEQQVAAPITTVGAYLDMRQYLG